MNAPPAPEKAPGWLAACAGGASVSMIMLAMGLVLALIDALAFHLNLGLGALTKLGLLYLSAFGGAPTAISADIFGSPASLVVGWTPMLGLLLSLWLLFRAGARAAGRGAGLSRGFAGMRVAPAYSLLSFAAAGVTTLSPVRIGTAGAHSSMTGAFVGPLLLACLAGFAGGLTADGGPAGARRLYGALIGGWATLAYGMAAAFVALMLLAALKPEYSRTYLAGFRDVRQEGGAAALAHNALLLPNESVWALAASMGVCDGIYGSVDIDVLCYSRFPDGLSARPELTPSDGGPLPVPTSGGGLPAVLLIFALVPPAAVLFGGAAAARAGSVGSFLEASAVGACSGVAFAPVFMAASYLSGVALRLEGVAGIEAKRIFLGPKLAMVVWVALAWGIPGGAIGGALGYRSLRRSKKRSFRSTPG